MNKRIRKRIRRILFRHSWVLCQTRDNNNRIVLLDKYITKLTLIISPNSFNNTFQDTHRRYPDIQVR